MRTKQLRYAQVWALYGLVGLVLGLALNACGDVDNNSTGVSGTVRPQTVIAGAQRNNDPRGDNPASGLVLDPTRSSALVNGATATPIPPQPTATSGPAPAATTAAAPAAGGGNAPAATTAAAAPVGNADNGAKLFTSLAPPCQSCHPNGGKNKGVGPVLAGTTRDDNYIHNQLKNGKGAMPAYPNLTNDQQNDLIAYIRSLK